MFPTKHKVGAVTGSKLSCYTKSEPEAVATGQRLNGEEPNSDNSVANGLNLGPVATASGSDFVYLTTHM